MAAPKETKRKGRPPKYAGEGKRQNFSFRIRDKTRERLIATVAETGRSLSEEIEYRIDQSFQWEDAFGDVRAYRETKMAEVKAIMDREREMSEARLARQKALGGAQFLDEEAAKRPPSSHVIADDTLEFIRAEVAKIVRAELTEIVHEILNARAAPRKSA
jgi:hypothetical protein